MFVGLVVNLYEFPWTRYSDTPYEQVGSDTVVELLNNDQLDLVNRGLQPVDCRIGLQIVRAMKLAEVRKDASNSRFGAKLAEQVYCPVIENLCRLLVAA